MAHLNRSIADLESMFQGCCRVKSDCGDCTPKTRRSRSQECCPRDTYEYSTCSCASKKSLVGSRSRSCPTSPGKCVRLAVEPSVCPNFCDDTKKLKSKCKDCKQSKVKDCSSCCDREGKQRKSKKKSEPTCESVWMTDCSSCCSSETRRKKKAKKSDTELCSSCCSTECKKKKKKKKKCTKKCGQKWCCAALSCATVTVGCDAPGDPKDPPRSESVETRELSDCVFIKEPKQTRDIMTTCRSELQELFFNQSLQSMGIDKSAASAEWDRGLSDSLKALEEVPTIIEKKDAACDPNQKTNVAMDAECCNTAPVVSNRQPGKAMSTDTPISDETNASNPSPNRDTTSYSNNFNLNPSGIPNFRGVSSCDPAVTSHSCPTRGGGGGGARGAPFAPSGAAAPALPPYFQNDYLHRHRNNRAYASCRQRAESGVSSPGCDVDSVAIGGACDAARAQYYHSKLLATLQILANKEETVRVQGESLAVAEARLAAVSARALRLRQQLDQRAQEITNLQCDVKCKKPCKKSDFSMCIQTETTEVEKLKEMVRTLQSNLSVIEELYRECFYEAAKQEDTIELLRDACAELRRRERGGARGQPGTAGNCHGKDVAAEVENLKREISDFLNSSNNDSGVWESPGADVAGELRDIMAQLAQLQGILSQECNCDLEEENAQLKKINETMKMQLGCQRQALQELECQLKAKSCETCHLAKQGAGKDEQITCMKRKMECLNQELCEKTETLCCLKSKLEKTQECLSARTAEAACGESRRAAAEECADALRGELEKANRELQEMCSVREEVRRLSTAVAAWRAQLADSERRAASLQCELEQARDHCRQLDACYREKASASCALQAQLEEAHARGAALCAEARRVVCAVRRWVRDMRRTHCIQEEKIKEQQAQICGLRCQLASQPPPCPPPPCPPPPCSACPVPPCGSTYLPSPSPPCSPRLCSPPCSPKPSCASAAARDAACAKCARRTGGDSIGCSKCARKSRDSTCFMAPSVRTRWPAAAKSETVQCERPPGARERATSPVPPRRVLRKKRVCGDERCVGACGRVDASAGPRRSDAAVGPPDAAPRRPPAPAAPAGAPPARPASPSPPRCTHRTHSAASRPVTRVVSPSQELLERVDKLQESLEVSQRRWQRARRPAPPAPPAATLIAHEDNDSA